MSFILNIKAKQNPTIGPLQFIDRDFWDIQKEEIKIDYSCIPIEKSCDTVNYISYWNAEGVIFIKGKNNFKNQWIKINYDPFIWFLYCSYFHLTLESWSSQLFLENTGYYHIPTMSKILFHFFWNLICCDILVHVFRCEEVIYLRAISDPKSMVCKLNHKNLLQNLLPQSEQLVFAVRSVCAILVFHCCLLGPSPTF